MSERPVRFIGSFNHSLDTKGRLVIPQNFRDKLGEKFCVAPSYDFKSIDARERILYRNYNSVKKDVDDLIKAVQTEFKKI